MLEGKKFMGLERMYDKRLCLFRRVEDVRKMDAHERWERERARIEKERREENRRECVRERRVWRDRLVYEAAVRRQMDEEGWEYEEDGNKSEAREEKTKRKEGSLEKKAIDCKDNIMSRFRIKLRR